MGPTTGDKYLDEAIRFMSSGPTERVGALEEQVEKIQEDLRRHQTIIEELLDRTSL